MRITIYIYNKYILVIFSPDALMFFGFVCGCKDDKSLGLVGVGYPGLKHSKDQVLPDTGLIVSKYFNVIIPEIFKIDFETAASIRTVTKEFPKAASAYYTNGFPKAIANFIKNL